MQLNRILFVLMGICLSHAFVYAQWDSTFYSPRHRWELGLNVTSVLSNFVGNKGDESLSPGSYPLYAKYLLSPQTALRLGLGGKWDLRQKSVQTPSPVFLETYDKALNTKLGFEFRTQLHKRVVVQYGADVLGQIANSSVNTATNIDVVNKRLNTLSVGGGPMLGLQFALNRRMHIGTETALYGLFESETQKLTFQNDPSLDEQSSNQNGRIVFNLPKWLYFIIRF